MKILFLSPHKHIIEFLESNGDEVICSFDLVTEEMLEDVDWIITYAYRRKIEMDVIERFKGKAINLHLSYLPYNRGADPNLWSFLEDTPKGVTIHYLDGSIDTGRIIMQERVEHDIEKDTLRTSYARLTETIEALFMKHWPDIRSGIPDSIPQLTYHRKSNKDNFQHLLIRGWDTPVKDLIGKAK